MPDLLLVNNNRQIIRVTECKSLMTENTKATLYIPQDQIQRCIDFSEIFRIYTTREVIFSFKFGRGYGKSYFFLFNRALYDEKFVYARCSYDGKCVVVIKDLPNDKQYMTLQPRQNLITE